MKGLAAALLFLAACAPALEPQPEKKETAMPEKTGTAVLAGGCFWGVEELVRALPGVLETRVGYTGGSLKDPSYEDVKTGKTGHAESIEVRFDPALISYGALLDFFFRIHDPTTPNRQGNDVGSQYRSAIFFRSPEQKAEAEAAIGRAAASGRWKRPVTTSVEPAGEFWAAEAYHQDYLRKNPGGYTCHYIRD